MSVLITLIMTGCGNENTGEGVLVEDSIHPDGMIVYEYWGDFMEEKDLPYADNKTFEIIEEAYSQVDFGGEFEKGNIEFYDKYKRAFL